MTRVIPDPRDPDGEIEVEGWAPAVLFFCFGCWLMRLWPMTSSKRGSGR